jgi:glycosyltransferase involved in cell wall biosynthesis
MIPAVSVVMAVFNGARFLPETLASLQAQTLGDFEIVIVDDGSTDDTPRLLDAFARAEPRCRILTQTNQGQVAARNLGVRSAKAPLIAWLDADDIAEPERFALQRAHLDSHPELAAVGSAIRTIDENSQVTAIVPYPTGPANVAQAMLSSSALAHSAVMMRRAAFMAIGGYREALLHTEDYDLWLRLLDGHSVDNLPMPLVRYRIHGGSISFRHRRQQSLAAFAARHSAAERRAGRPDPLEGRLTPVGDEIFAELSIGAADEGAFRLECLAAALHPAGQPLEGAWLEDNIARTWELRGHLPRGRHVRRCLVPYARRAWSLRHWKESLVWLARAFSRQPLAACWRLLGGK